MKTVSFSQEEETEQFQLDQLVEELLAPFCEEEEDEEDEEDEE
jgi:hypothetical protein